MIVHMVKISESGSIIGEFTITVAVTESPSARIWGKILPKQGVCCEVMEHNIWSAEDEASGDLLSKVGTGRHGA